MSNTNLVFVYKGKSKQKIHTVDLPAWQKAGWSTNLPIVDNQKIVTEPKNSKARSKSAKNAVQEQIERGEIEE